MNLARTTRSTFELSGKLRSALKQWAALWGIDDYFNELVTSFVALVASG